MTSEYSTSFSSLNTIALKLPLPLCQYILSLFFGTYVASVLAKPHSKLNLLLTIKGDSCKKAPLLKIYIETNNLICMTIVDPTAIIIIQC